MDLFTKTQQLSALLEKCRFILDKSVPSIMLTEAITIFLTQLSSSIQYLIDKSHFTFAQMLLGPCLSVSEKLATFTQLQPIVVSSLYSLVTDAVCNKDRILISSLIGGCLKSIDFGKRATASLSPTLFRRTSKVTIENREALRRETSSIGDVSSIFENSRRSSSNRRSRDQHRQNVVIRSLKQVT